MQRSCTDDSIVESHAKYQTEKEKRGEKMRQNSGLKAQRVKQLEPQRAEVWDPKDRERGVGFLGTEGGSDLPPYQLGSLAKCCKPQPKSN